MPTVYTVHDNRDVCYPVFDAERAARLSRAGLRVTATTTATAE
jgi:hypothetical protein